MRLHAVAAALALAGAHGATAHVLADGQISARGILDGPRTQNMLAMIPGLSVLPALTSVLRNLTYDIKNIQGDILVGMHKKTETFVFFSIGNSTGFKSNFKSFVHQRITSAAQLLDVSKQPQAAINVAFSQSGLTKLGVTDNVQDAPFTAGQASDANNLGDPGLGRWVPAFKNKDKLHGVFLVASDTQALVDAGVAFLQKALGSDMSIVYRLKGQIRPGSNAGHEMFGYLDGISQPALAGFNLPKPGQQLIPPGVIVTGALGDTLALQRPPWMKDGSFMAFRQLQQLVPEFDAFKEIKAPNVTGLQRKESVDLFGARMIGRWKSGAPVDLSPLKDDPALGADPNRNNNFNFVHLGDNFLSDQSKCPFHAHIRKTHPRADLPAPLNAIMRAGIPYGGEVTASELSTKNSDPARERGLAFVSYQSQIAQGFQFQQVRWANNPAFVTGKATQPGWDPIIGQNKGAARTVSGYDLTNANKTMTLEKDFVVSRGGEYFFTPSLSALQDVITA